ncbi:MAG TPA: AzlC family ABC transporter permease, partial [Defluviitaleaceae bacterium]|nr:AzlC family ABC transporter permease [Defluviitaleaceae bacterium]
WDCFLFSLFVFAGASQFMAVNLIAATVPAFQIILTTAVMNLRHFLMSASLADKIKSPRKKLIPLVAFGITDETFSVLATKNKELSFFIPLQSIQLLIFHGFLAVSQAIYWEAFCQKPSKAVCK